MLEAIIVLLVILWALGFIGYAAAGWVHVLLIVAFILLIIRLAQGRQVL